jgi:hypothetical protein
MMYHKQLVVTFPCTNLALVNISIEFALFLLKLIDLTRQLALLGVQWLHCTFSIVHLALQISQL